MGGALDVGETIRLPVFDPTSLSTRTVEVHVLEHDTLFVTDSAALDTGTGRWTSARMDSIPAWKIAEVFGGIRVESWVDADGRILRASSPLGFDSDQLQEVAPDGGPFDVSLITDAVIPDATAHATGSQISSVTGVSIHGEGVVTGEATGARILIGRIDVRRLEELAELEAVVAVRSVP